MNSFSVNFLIVPLLLALTGCKQVTKEEAKSDVYESFGDSITLSQKWEAKEMDRRFSDLGNGDTIAVKFTSKILEVCPKKGCWMKVELADDRQAMVRFRDYSFFVPTDASGKVVIEGKAYVEEMSVEDLKHYAEDAGKSEEEIAQITEPKITYGIEADGVLIKQ